jgi:ubiquinone biosynthesis protein UbiJ
MEPSTGPPANAAEQLKDRIGQMERTLEALKQRLGTLEGEAKD